MENQIQQKQRLQRKKSDMCIRCVDKEATEYIRSTHNIGVRRRAL